jgi:hypothetical protein
MINYKQELLGGLFLGVVTLTLPIWLRWLIAWDLGVLP